MSSGSFGFADFARNTPVLVKRLVEQLHQGEMSPSSAPAFGLKVGFRVGRIESLSAPQLRYEGTIRCLASDPRMAAVWASLLRKNHLGFAHPAVRNRVESHRQVRAVAGLLSFQEVQGDVPSLVQQQAAGIMFLEAADFVLRQSCPHPIDRLGASCTTRTPSTEVETLRSIAKRLRQEAEGLREFGLAHSAKMVIRAAEGCETLLDIRLSGDQGATACRALRPGRARDERVRAFIVQIAQGLQIFSGMNGAFRTIATITNVALERSDVTEGMVQRAL